MIFPFDNPVSEAEKDPDLTAKIRREMPVIIRHLLAMFADQNKAKALLIEQRDSAEALGVKRGTDPVIDMCAALYFMNEPKGMMMGAERGQDSQSRELTCITFIWPLWNITG